ncbi:MAG: DUF692 domain-containing protein [Mycobacteriaceae bacterium]
MVPGSGARGSLLHDCGVGVAWRPQIAQLLLEQASLDDAARLHFTEIIAENLDKNEIPTAIAELLSQGVEIIPHGVSLGLAGAQQPSSAGLHRLAELADVLGSPLVSEHIAFVRTSGAEGKLHDGVLDSGYLLPPPRTYDSLKVLVDNVKQAQDQLPVPLALENIATCLLWPEDELSEPDFLAELVSRTQCWVLLDVANLYATCSAVGSDPHKVLRRFPLDRIAYIHVAGGKIRNGFYIDTHADPIIPPVLDLLEDAISLTPGSCGILLERDSNITEKGITEELNILRSLLIAGAGL